MMRLAVSEGDMVKAESLVAKVGKDYADSAMFAVETYLDGWFDDIFVQRIAIRAGPENGEIGSASIFYKETGSTPMHCAAMASVISLILVNALDNPFSVTF